MPRTNRRRLHRRRRRQQEAAPQQPKQKEPQEFVEIVSNDTLIAGNTAKLRSVMYDAAGVVTIYDPYIVSEILFDNRYKVIKLSVKIAYDPRDRVNYLANRLREALPEFQFQIRVKQQ